MRMSDWSSDVCSSDLRLPQTARRRVALPVPDGLRRPHVRARDRRVAAAGARRSGRDDRGGRTRRARGSARAGAADRDLGAVEPLIPTTAIRSEEHTSELQSLMRNSYADFCLKKKKQKSDIKTR